SRSARGLCWFSRCVGASATPASVAAFAPRYRSARASAIRAVPVTPQPHSFYETGRSADELGRLFLFSYHFPPDTAAGALRWQKLANHAAKRGWGLDVLTRDPAELERADPSRLRELPPGVRVFG